MRIKSCGSGRNGCRVAAARGRSCGLASTSTSGTIRFHQSASSIATPPRAKLSREEPDAGNRHVRVCGGRGWQHPRLPGFGMRVTRRVAARAEFDEHTLDALAGNVRQLVLVDEGHPGVLRLRQAANRGRLSWSPYPLVGRRGIRLLPVSGGAIRRDRCGRGAPRPTARASAPRPGRPSIGPRGHAPPRAGRRPPSDSGRRFR